MLDSFFETIGSGALDNTDYYLDGLQHTKGEAQSEFGWVEDLPPVFHGSATSFTHPRNQHAMVPQVLPNDTSIAGHRHTSTPQQGQVISPSAEMLAAASTLVQNGQLSMPSSGAASDLYSFRPPEATDALRRAHGNRRSMDHIPTVHYNGRSSNVSDSFPLNTQLQAGSLVNGEHLLGGMFYGDPNQASASHLHTTKGADIRWGSDAGFFGHGFVAPSNQETVEEVTNTMLHKMECLEPQTSAPNSRPSSPTLIQKKRPDSVVNQNLDNDPEDGERGDEDDGSRARPKKRRKAKMKAEENEGQQLVSSKPRKRGKSVSTKKIVRSRRASLVDTTPKRDRSLSGEQKSGRENLTTEQKRSNHILSEQKRRNLIKQGFDDLCVLVPELKGGGFSKSAMLTQAADWLEELVRGNEQLKVQLAKLKGRDSI